jgi:hypothetical protein
MNTQDSIEKEPEMRQRLLEKWRLFTDVLAGIDDPHGEYLRALENRIRRLEGEVEDVRKHLLTETRVSVRSGQRTPDHTAE